MTAVKSLHELIAPAYLAGATKAAKARRWLDAESDLVRYAALLPGDYRAPLLRAKICLREGRWGECMAALDDARRLGHERSENDRMVAWLRDNDRRRRDRLAFRDDFQEQLQSLLSSLREQVYLLGSNFWPKCSAHLLFACGIIAVSVLWHLVHPS